MIVVITNWETNPKTGHKQLIVSHGVDSETLQDIVLPNETPEALGAVFDQNIKEYVLH